MCASTAVEPALKQVSYARCAQGSTGVDHVLPRSRGGKGELENLVWADKAVNARKGNRLPHEAGLKLLNVPCAPKELPVTAPYALEEVLHNLADLPPSASVEWARLRPALLVMDDVLTLNRPAVFPVGKDRPILFSALAWADVLLTLDQADFAGLMENPFYGLLVLKPGVFLQKERADGRLQ